MITTMKESKYNFFYEDGEVGNIMAYNSRTNALATIEESKFHMFKEYIEHDLEISDDKLVSQLLKGGFLVEQNVNEVELIKFGMLSSRYNSDNLGLTIAPTLNCNFRCTYCYEKDSIESKSMSGEVQVKLLEYVKSRIKLISTLNITWYGGEPLLEISIIEKLSRAFMQLCDENNVRYNASMITNGYCMTNRILVRLRELKITGIQITLDGAQKVHDARRPLANGKGTYNRIVDNLVEATRYFDNIQIRINVDKSNMKSIEKILDDIERLNLKKKIFLYLGFVVETNDCYKESVCLKSAEYSEINHEFINSLHIRGFSTNITTIYPTIKRNFCGADLMSSNVVDPYGRLYKCWHDIGISELSIGSIMGKENVQPSQNTYLSYMMYDPTEDEECIDCKLLPVCMGGCPRKRIDKTEDRCIEQKYTIEAALKKTAQLGRERRS